MIGCLSWFACVLWTNFGSILNGAFCVYLTCCTKIGDAITFKIYKLYAVSNITWMCGGHKFLIKDVSSTVPNKSICWILRKCRWTQMKKEVHWNSIFHAVCTNTFILICLHVKIIYRHSVCFCLIPMNHTYTTHTCKFRMVPVFCLLYVSTFFCFALSSSIFHLPSHKQFLWNFSYLSCEGFFLFRFIAWCQNYKIRFFFFFVDCFGIDDTIDIIIFIWTFIEISYSF